MELENLGFKLYYENQTINMKVGDEFSINVIENNEKIIYQGEVRGAYLRSDGIYSIVILKKFRNGITLIKPSIMEIPVEKRKGFFKKNKVEKVSANIKLEDISEVEDILNALNTFLKDHSEAKERDNINKYIELLSVTK